jgi:hypothetical protein
MRVREEGLRWIYNYITLRNQWWLSWFEILRMRTKVKALKRDEVDCFDKFTDK